MPLRLAAVRPRIRVSKLLPKKVKQDQDDVGELGTWEIL
jgi:hypothetical protein